MGIITTDLEPVTLQKTKTAAYHHIDMNRIAAVILGGGEGARLMPLTSSRCKPAICFGGKYRLVDVPMSNAINCGCFKIYLITQFLSASLHQHILRTYQLGGCLPGFVEILTAEQRPSQKIWFQGTADAVRQNIDYLSEISVDYFLILSGDQLYHMDFRKMVQVAKETDANLVIAALPVASEEARRMGILKLNQNHFAIDFCEKPQREELLDELEMGGATRSYFSTQLSPLKKYLGSMGIYLFKRQALINLLLRDSREDFGKHLIPSMVSQGEVAAFLHEGYWEDIGTIESFYHANIALTQNSPAFNCYDESHPIRSSNSLLPSPKISKTSFNQSIICDGSRIEADEISNSILGLRTVVKSGSIIRNSYLMGNDHYQFSVPSNQIFKSPQIGENCIIEKALIDKNVILGNGVQLINKHHLHTYTSEDGQVYIRDGIIVIPRGAEIPDGFVI